jgi:cobyrinic acid a,c-diamide synthase
VRGLVIAAPASGSGKTTVTLGLLRALARRGVVVRAAKSGPDYIDPRFHEAALRGLPCVNLDAWAMGAARLRALAGGEGFLVVEGAMGLFDGAPPDGRGATADLARLLGLPVVLVVDAGRMAQSVGPLVAGFARHDPTARVAGVVLNRVGSERHRLMLTRAVEAAGLPVVGALPRLEALGTHRGTWASCRPRSGRTSRPFSSGRRTSWNGTWTSEACSGWRKGQGCRRGGATDTTPRAGDRRGAGRGFRLCLSAPSRRLAAGGAELRFFSPLADDAVPEAGLVVCQAAIPSCTPGASRRRTASCGPSESRGTSQIYGECGGYMVLGETLVDAQGRVHRMAGLLSLATSFSERRLHLGYRTVQTDAGPFPGRWTAHEFHYATVLREEGAPAFRARDAEGAELRPMGLRAGRVSGSFAHLIDRADGQPRGAGVGDGT